MDEALAAAFGPAAYRIRFEWRDANFVLLADLTPAVSNPSVSLDNERQLPRELSCTLDADLLPPFFDVSRSFVGITVYLLMDGVWTEFPFGLFKLDASTRTVRSNNRKDWPVRGADTLAILQQAHTSKAWTYSGGQLITTEVANICASFGLVCLIVPAARALATYTAWGPGTSYLDIVNDLLEAANYFPATTDNRGRVISRERIDPATVLPSAIYSTVAPTVLLDTDFTRTTDVSRGANQVVVTIDDPNRATGFALRQNSDIRSPVSTYNQGFPTLVQVNGDRVVSLAVAGDIAEYLLRKADGDAQPATLQTVFDPRRGPLEAYQLTIETEEIGTIWTVKGWTVRLDSTPLVMDHRLTRAQPLSIDTLLSL